MSDELYVILLKKKGGDKGGLKGKRTQRVTVGVSLGLFISVCIRATRRRNDG